MSVILSIKPVHVQKIISGAKRYEFRRVIFRDRSACVVYIYSTSPVKKIIGKFRVGKILDDHPESLWEQLHEYSGLTRKDFYAYFSGKTRGYAIEITNLELFEEPIDPGKLIPNFVAPQSFQYIEDSIFKHQPDSNNANTGNCSQVVA